MIVVNCPIPSIDIRDPEFPDLSPIGPRLYVAEHVTVRKSHGGILMPDTDFRKKWYQHQRQGLVLKVGFIDMPGGRFAIPDVKEGDKVFFSKGSNKEKDSLLLSDIMQIRPICPLWLIPIGRVLAVIDDWLELNE